MKKTRREYEATIEKLARDFFTLSSEESYSVLKKTLRNKLWTEIWHYCKNCQYVRRENTGEDSRAEKYSGVINETICKCFEAFDPKKGTSFVSYLNAAMAKEIFREQQEDYAHGIKIPSKTRSLWKYLRNLAEYHGIASENISEMIKLGMSIGKSEKETVNALVWGKVVVVSDIAQNLSGENYSLFDSVAVLDSAEDPFEKITEAKSKRLHTIFTSIEDVFCKKQARLKTYLSALLTLKFFDALFEWENDSANLIPPLFIDLSLYSELKECVKSEKPFPSQQDIAKRFNKDKTDASRSLNKFFKELRNTMPKKCQLFAV